MIPSTSASTSTSHPLHLTLELVRAAATAERYGVTAGEWNHYLLLDPDDAGRHTESDFLWKKSIVDDLAATADAAALAEVTERLAAAMQTFLDNAGWQRLAARIADARAHGRPVVLTLRSVAHELSGLPWELARVGDARLCELPDCLLRFDCLPPRPDDRDDRDDPAHPAPAPDGRVLLAWSAAGGAVPAAEHLGALEATAGREGAFQRRRDELRGASLASLAAELAAPGKPPVAILHLLCHGQPLPGQRAFGLRLDGEDAPVAAAALRRLLEPHRRTLRLVVLSACHGSATGAIDNAHGSLAEALRHAGVPAVIASRYPLSAAGSACLARVLYQQLFGELASLERAFLAARRALGAIVREPDEAPQLDAAALQLHADSALGLDFRPWIVAPYRGLAPYGRAHERFFFGRQGERLALRQRIASTLDHPGEPRLLLVAGASGTGKSSLVLAGLLHDLERPGAGELTAPAAWTSRVLRLGSDDDPLEPLARCLAEHRAAAPPPGDAAPPMLALVVDQLEELFTSVAPARREPFLRELWRLACDPAERVFVIATVRIEYLGRFGTLRMNDRGVPFDRELLDPERTFLVRQLGPEQYEAIVRGPAERVGVHLEPGVLAQLLDAVRAEPGALPLLSYTLDQLWQRRAFRRSGDLAGWWLTDDAYARLGRVAGAVATTAAALLARLGEAHRDELRRVLVQLVHGHDDPMLATRRRGWRLAMRPLTSEHELDSAESLAYDQTLDALIEARLLVQGEELAVVQGEELAEAHSSSRGPWLELAHDSLIRFWPQLQEWYRDARAWLAHTDELRRLATSWRDRAAAPSSAPADDDYLLRGQRLAKELAAWQLHRHHLGAGDRAAVQRFLDACVRGEEALRHREQQRQRDRVKERVDSARDLVVKLRNPLATFARYKLRLIGLAVVVAALAIGAVVLGASRLRRAAPAPLAAPAADSALLSITVQTQLHGQPVDDLELIADDQRARSPVTLRLRPGAALRVHLVDPRYAAVTRDLVVPPGPSPDPLVLPVELLAEAP